MKLFYESELMKNQKHANIMAPDIAFEVLQASNGDAIFFSIGTDNIFYVTREVRQTGTGWDKADLSSSLSTQHWGAAVAAKSFALAQDPQTQLFDVALVLTVDGVDFLYISLNNSSVPSNWTNISWTPVPFDAEGIAVPTPFTIADVYLMQIPASDESDAILNCFVDITRDPGNPFKPLDRYYIQPGNSPQWSPRTLPIDLTAGSISSCLGNRLNDWVPGIYTFGEIGQTPELIFTPQYNFFNPIVAPNSASFDLPDGATAICSALDANGNTNLFVAAASGLFVFTPDNQDDRAVSVPVSDNSIVKGAPILSASTVAASTVLWGVNPQGDLFYLRCASGSESEPSAWSNPVPLCSGARSFAFYLNINAANNVLFVHLDNEQLLQLTQDPVTSLWSQRTIVLPTTSVDDMIEFNSFTTHIRVTDDNGVNIPNTPVQLTSTSPVSVYINDVYYVLTPSVAVSILADSSGTVTVINQTQSLTATCFRVTCPTVVADINPLSKAMQILSTIKSGDDLTNVQITTANGTQKPLIPSSISSDDKSATASFLTQALNVASTLPANGSAKSSVRSENNHLPKTWGVSFSKTGMTYHEGHEAEKLFLPKSGRSDFLDGFGVAIGDLFSWFKTCIDTVESIVIHAAEDAYYIICKIADTVYHAILDTVSAVVGAIEWVFHKIEVFFEDLVAWLGFLFQWADINRTHKVMKNIVKQYASRLTFEIDKLENGVNTIFNDLQSEVNAWAGLTDNGQSIGTKSAASANTPGIHSPQSNWALYHTKSNISSGNTSYTGSSDFGMNSDPLNGIVQDLKKLFDQESNDLIQAVQQIKTIADEIQSLSPAQVVQKLFAVITDLILDTAKNVIVKILDIIKIIVSMILDMLEAPIDIPIISSFYRTITGDQLTFLDLACLVGAIPVTIVYKIVAGVAPYPDNHLTQALIEATNFDTITQLLTGSASSLSLEPEPLAQMVDARAGAGASRALSLSDTVNASLNLMALFGSLLVVGFSDLKRPGNSGVVLRCGAAASYLVCAAPNYAVWISPKSWYTIMNDCLTLLSIGKTFMDNTSRLDDKPSWSDYISPAVDTCMGVLFIIPAAGSIGAGIVGTPGPGAADWTAFAQNMVIDVSGILTVLTSEKFIEPPVPDIVFGITKVLTLAYGGICVATGVAIINQ